MDIAVIGSINMDYSSKVMNLPREGETVQSQTFQMMGGGKGANQAIAASRLGTQVFMIGAVGLDGAGKSLLGRLKGEGVDTRGIYELEEPTGNALITIDAAGNNTIVVYPGANAFVTPKMIDAHSEVLYSCRAIVLQLEIPLDTVYYVCSLAHDRGIPIILDPAPATMLPRDIYTKIHTITPNETEIKTLTGTNDIEEGAKHLIDLGVDEVIVTLGGQGCFYTNGVENLYVDGFSTETIDSTAAGDSFNGAFATAMVEHRSIQEALRLSNAVGSLTTTKLGAYDALPYRREVEEFLASH